MLCPRCGYYSDKEDSVCPECGEILSADAGLPTEGAESIRQGKRARTAILDAAGKQMLENRRRRRSGASRATVEMPAIHDEREDGDFPDYTVSETINEADNEENGEPEVFERRRRSVYDENAAMEEQEKAYSEWIGRGGPQRIRTVNWMKVYLVVFIMLVFAIAGTWLFLKKTEAGQRLMARMGKEATSSALWAVGEELMNTGDMEGAIINFEKARAQDQREQHVDVDGLLMLAGAYEAVERIDDAARLYEEIYTETPSRTEAYVNHIRILMNSGNGKDQKKAGELMKKAYEQTGEASFETQRSDLLPAPPQIRKDQVAAYYDRKMYLEISSTQGYDVYYNINSDAELPEGGTKYTEPIFLDEGVWEVRYVAVNGDLVSDVVKGAWKISLPSPQTPRCNLAPGAYKNRQKVKLFPGKDNENDDDIQIYYTVDGSIPNITESPLYKNEPILLPSGHTVTIRAMAVNSYKKPSNVLEVSFKIDAKPYPLTAWDMKETINGLEMNKTTMPEFQKEYGEGTQVSMEPIPGFEKDAEFRKHEYPWGYTVMNLVKRNWVLVELYFKEGSPFKAPRETGVGDPMDYVVGKFRDMGQLESEKGIRCLYHLDSGSDGKIIPVEETGGKIIQYRIRLDGHWYQLEYHTDSRGTVTAIDWKYLP